MGIRTQRGQECALSWHSCKWWGSSQTQVCPAVKATQAPAPVPQPDGGRRQVGQSCYINTCPGIRWQPGLLHCGSRENSMCFHPTAHLCPPLNVHFSPWVSVGGIANGLHVFLAEPWKFTETCSQKLLRYAFNGFLVLIKEMNKPKPGVSFAPVHGSSTA